MRTSTLVPVVAVALLAGVWSASPTHAQGGGCAPGSVQGDLSQTVTGLVQSAQAPDEAQGQLNAVADAARQNNVRILCINAPGSDNPMVDSLIQSQLQAIDAYSSMLASNPDLSNLLAQNNIDLGRTVIVGADLSTQPVLLYVWNRR